MTLGNDISYFVVLVHEGPSSETLGPIIGDGGKSVCTIVPNFAYFIFLPTRLSAPGSLRMLVSRTTPAIGFELEVKDLGLPGPALAIQP